MQNFNFYNPTQIVFGKETVGRIADLVPPRGARAASVRRRERTNEWNARRGEVGAGHTIRRTRALFESLGVKTHLADYAVETAAIDGLIEQLDAHGMTQLGEHRDVTLDVSRRVLQASF